VSKLKREDLLEAGTQKSYTEPARIAGVEVFPLTRHVDDRGSFLELYRASAAGDHGSGLAAFFAGITVGQLNYSLVTTSDHVKGLHVHLAQDDVWFCPPPFKMKVVLLDLRKNSPTRGTTQVVVLGEGRDAWVKIPAGVAHGYRPLTVPCGLFYLVTRPFDPADPDEHRIPWDHPSVRDLWEVRKE